MSSSVDLSVLPAFVGMVLVFLLPPGPDMAFVVGAGLGGGRRAAVAGIAGIGTGMCVFVLAAAIGVGQALRATPGLLDGLQLAGAAYLLWLAWSTVRATGRRADGAEVSGGGRPWRRGLVVSLTNPKILLFHVAVLPQFIGAADHVGAQLVMLGLVSVVSEVVLYGSLGIAAASTRERLGGRRARTATGYLAGFVYLALAAVVAVEVTTG